MNLLAITTLIARISFKCLEGLLLPRTGELEHFTEQNYAEFSSGLKPPRQRPQTIFRLKSESGFFVS